MKRFIYCFIALPVLALALCAAVCASDAVQLTDAAITDSGGASVSPLTDDSEATYASVTSLSVECSAPVAGIYIKFDKSSKAWTLTGGEKSAACGKDGFLHEFVDSASLVGSQTKLTLDFGEGASIADIYLFGEGDIPAWVQVWQKPYERADLLLMPTHSDDEHLFFAGILPYCSDRGIYAQVVYLTNHFDRHDRPHEQLNGLWEAGVTHYPVIGPFPDLYSESISAALSGFSNAGYSEDDFLAYQVECLRRFKPLVVVTHAKNGEYGHGAHMLNYDTLIRALPLASDSANYPESAEKYGVWDTPKAYVHVMEENAIVLDWDTPLENFGGRSAFQVSQDCYRLHKSQHVFPDLSRWLYGADGTSVTKASQITANSPQRFGLYRSLVGDDADKNSFFENVTLYSYIDSIPPEPETEPATEPVTAPVTVPVTDAVTVAAEPEKSGAAAIPTPVLIILIATGAICIAAVCFLTMRKSFRTKKHGGAKK